MPYSVFLLATNIYMTPCFQRTLVSLHIMSTCWIMHAQKRTIWPLDSLNRLSELSESIDSQGPKIWEMLHLWMTILTRVLLVCCTCMFLFMLHMHACLHTYVRCLHTYVRCLHTYVRYSRVMVAYWIPTRTVYNLLMARILFWKEQNLVFKNRWRKSFE